MHRIARAAGVTLVVATAAVLTGSPAPADASPSQSFGIAISSEGRQAIVGGDPGHAGRTTGYWGRFASDDGRSGGYRAICTWLGESAPGGNKKKRDPRLLCTIVFSFRAEPGGPGDPNGGTLVAQGLMLRPKKKDTLFTRPSSTNPAVPRTLPITGATGYYRGQQGVIWVEAPGRVQVAFDV